MTEPQNYTEYLQAEYKKARQDTRDAWDAVVDDLRNFKTGGQEKIKAHQTYLARCREQRVSIRRALDVQKKHVSRGGCPHPWDAVVTQGETGDAPDNYLWQLHCTVCRETLEVE